MKKTILTLIAVACLLAPESLPARQISARGLQQIQALLTQKAHETPAQRKLDTHLYWAGQLARGRSSLSWIPAVADSARTLKFDARRRVLVDIRARVTDGLLNRIVALGGTVQSSLPKYNAIRAWIPLTQAETLAGEGDVNFIRPAEYPIHNDGPVTLAQERAQSQARENWRGQLAGALDRSRTIPIPSSSQTPITNTAPIDTKARVSHGADLVAAMGITGTGIKVGVISDGVDSLATLQAAGNLPNDVTVISGQAGSGDEGTAMLEIVYDMAPGAQLYFATGNGGPAQMATNIEALAVAGCNIIVDDLTYLSEGVFQDGPIAQEVTTVTVNGVLYFSSAANSGNVDSSTSGTWEGDFDGTGADIPAIDSAEGGTYPVHAFDASHNYDSLTSLSGNSVFLQWSAPLGGSCDDYDFFWMDSSLSTIKGASYLYQNCGQDPYEVIPQPANAVVGDALVVVLFAGSARALHVDTMRGQLSINTDGSTFGHNAAASTVTVAATPVQSSIFTSGNQSPEYYSSDGPRRIFYHPLGTPITADNFLFATNGGTELSKVDLTAGDCGQGAVSGFTTFCGTSAAAPTAASIAALVWSASPGLTGSQVLDILKNTALPAHSGFNTRTVGAGIVMANLAVNSVMVSDASLSPPAVFFGNQSTGVNSTSQLVTLSSTGSASLTINNYSISGGNSGDFNIQSTTCSGSLAAGNNCTFSVRFNPTATGPRKSYLMISDSSAAATHKSLLTGVGTATMVSPVTLTFSDQTVSTTSSPQVVTITNNSSSLMHLWQIRIGGTNAGDFSKTTTCGSTLAVSANCTVSVSFAPTATGARSATLLFSDDGADSPQAVTLSGNGLSALKSIKIRSAVPQQE